MLTSGTILFVGTDICARMNVLAAAGYHVLRCGSDPDSLRQALVHTPVEAVLFQCIPQPPSRPLLATARILTNAPVILFADPSSIYDTRDFDAVLMGLCSPHEWLPEIAEAIKSHRNADRSKPPQSASAPQDASRIKDHR